MAEKEKKEGKTNKKGLLKSIGNIFVGHFIKLIAIVLIIIIAATLLAGVSNELDLIDSKEDGNNSKNAPAAVKRFSNDISIDDKGNISLGRTPIELWQELKEQDNELLKYVDSVEELAKIMNVQTAMEYPYTGKDPEKAHLDGRMLAEKIDSTDIQGIIKFKREIDGNNSIYMEYINNEEFQKIMDEYNNAKNDAERNNIKNRALRVFTMEKGTGSYVSSISGNGENSNTNVDITNSSTSHWPVAGRTHLSRAFFPGHSGIDIPAPIGTNIEAVESGIVYQTGYISDGAGNYIMIDHGNNTYTRYCHMNEPTTLKKGDQVAKGQVVGHVGNTGNSTGPHLHFVVLVGGTSYANNLIDPLAYTYDNTTDIEDRRTGRIYKVGTGNGPIGSTIQVSNQTSYGTGTQYIAKIFKFSESRSIRQSNNPDEETYDRPTYSISTQEINYRSYVDKYMMPFDYLFTLLVLTKDKQFVLQLADLIYDSKMEITVRDNVTTTTTVETETYRYKTEYEAKDFFIKFVLRKITHFATQEEAEEGIPNTVENINMRLGPYSKDGKEFNPSEDNDPFYVKTTNIHKEDSLDIGLTLADTWFIKYEEKYEHKHEDNHEISNVTNTLDDIKTKDDKTVEGDPENLALEFINNIKTTYNRVDQEVLDNTIELDGIVTKYKYTTIDRSKNTVVYEEKDHYINSPAEVTEKTDKNSAAANFVTILLGNPNALDAILSNTDLLYEMLENNEDTKDYVDLTKYFLYKATDRNYGALIFDDIWKKLQEKYITVLGNKSGLSGNVGIIFDFLLSKGVSPQGCAGIIGNWMQESGCNPNNLENGANNKSGLSDEEFTKQVNNGTISKNEFISSSRFKASESYGSDIYGYGLAQWTSQGRKANLYDFAKSYTGYTNGFDISDINMQLEYFWKEFQGYPEALDAIVNATDVANATHIFHRKYEISADPASTERIKYAEEVYSQYLENNRNLPSTNAGTVFYQEDYAHVKYGDGTIASYGCGPTCFAMIASDYLGRKITPEDALSWCGTQYFISGVGTTYSYFYAATKHFNLPCECVQIHSSDFNSVTKELMKGNLVVSWQSRGIFTGGNHFILLSSIDSDGKIRVRDPSRYNAVTRKYNERAFTQSEIMASAVEYWVFRKK